MVIEVIYGVCKTESFLLLSYEHQFIKATEKQILSMNQNGFESESCLQDI